MKASTLRIFCSTVGILGLAFILASKATTPPKVVGSIICIFFILFGFLVTGGLRKYIIGEQVDDAMIQQQSYGRMGVG